MSLFHFVLVIIWVSSKSCTSKKASKRNFGKIQALISSFVFHILVFVAFDVLVFELIDRSKIKMLFMFKIN